MRISIVILLTFFQISTIVSQEKQESLPIISKEVYLDSIKKTFIKHSTSSCIDKRWIAELTNEEIFEELLSDITDINIDNKVELEELSTELLKERLVLLNSKTPFDIEYNPALENVIKSFLKHRKTSYGRLMAISDYYFPMFEEQLAKYDIPLELKYLAIVESALNPRAKSRVGASGLWQFMYPTGKMFNLNVDSYVDERYDPLKATEAACQYLSSLYNIFGDWSMVLASYNAGPGNVSKAIRRSGGSQNYWSIRKNLPRETANYVPAFFATMYIYEFHKEHNITPKAANIVYFETDTIAVKRKMSFKDLADLLEIPEEEITFLNPVYKLGIIPYHADKINFIRLPKDKLGLFLSNEEKMYAYIDFKNRSIDDKIQDDDTLVESDLPSLITKHHKVRKGENLGLIANKYNVSVGQLKQWNNLRSNNIQVGKTLKIQSKHSSTPSKSSANKSYVVKSGDSLYSIAKKFPGVSVQNLKDWNDISGNNLKPGKRLTIKG